MALILHLASIYFDPPRVAFTLPLIDRPVFWYGLCFVSGFLLAYLLMIPLLSRFLSDLTIPNPRALARSLCDRLCWFAIFGTVIGARLGDVFFYHWDYFQRHLIDILKIWNGGLASHGGVIGVMMAFYLFCRITQKKIPELTFLSLLDLVCIPTALVACCIRLGNFMNQEIVGVPSDLPWAVLFAHPLDAVSPVPRHPVQLYEAIAYFLTFCLLGFLWKKEVAKSHPGALLGVMFLAIFGSRFILEYWKSTQDSSLLETFPLTPGGFSLQIGQLLSIPFIFLGLILLIASFYKQKASRHRSLLKRKK